MKNNHPKIGIRPIIDGRRGGIRESLEEMTMGMAHLVADLYSKELRYNDGEAVECVIADTTIGGVKEAALATEKFKQNIDREIENNKKVLFEEYKEDINLYHLAFPRNWAEQLKK